MMDFLFFTDDKNHAKWYGVLMLSILRFAPPPEREGVRFHFITKGIPKETKAALEGIASSRKNTELCFYNPTERFSEKDLKNINIALAHSRWPIAIFYNLLAPDLLPSDIHKVLCLDSDIVCAGSLEELFRIDLKDSPEAMCLERIESLQAPVNVFNRLGYPREEGYFNGGVVLLNLDIWRKENLKEEILEWMAANMAKCTIGMQDASNVVFHGRIFQLDFSCNVMPFCLYVFYWLQEEKNNYYAATTQFLPKAEWPALREAVERPRLVHIYGLPKPWHRECNNPFASVWRYFYAQSPWGKEPLKRWAEYSKKQRIQLLARRALERLNLVSVKNYPYPEEAYKSAQRILDKLIEEDARAGK